MPSINTVSTDTGTDTVVPSTAPVVTDTTHQIMYTTVVLLCISLIAIAILVMVLILTCTQLKRYKILFKLHYIA